MKITIEAKALAKAMKYAASILPSQSIIPIAANVRLVAKGKALEITTCDFDSEFRQTLPLTAKGEMSATVDAKRLLAIANAAPTDAVLSMSLSESRMTVTAGRSRWVLSVLPIDDFPILPVETIGAPVTISSASLAKALRRVEWSIYSDIGQLHMRGVYLHGDEGKVRLATANGHAFTVATLGEEFPAEAPAITMTDKFAGTLATLAEAHEGDLQLAWDERKIRATLGDTTITGKLMETKFPNYHRVIPIVSAESVSITVEPESMVAALRRVMVIADERTRCVKIERAPDMIRLSSSDGVAGLSSEEVQASCAAGFESGVNGQYLDKIMAAIGGDSVEIHQADANSAMLFRRVVPDGALVVAMPMRI